MGKYALIGAYTLSLMGSASAQWGGDPLRAIDRSLAEQQRLNDQWRLEQQMRQRQWDMERRIDDLEFKQRMQESDWQNYLMERRR
jgi:hypothetical protein